MKQLQGKIAVITGSTRGLGLAMAKAYAREGAAVVISSRTSPAAAVTVDKLRAAGHQVAGPACDVVDANQVKAFG